MLDIVVTTCPKYAHLLPTQRACMERLPAFAGAHVTVLGADHDEGWTVNLLRFLWARKNDKPFILLLDDYMLATADGERLGIAEEFFLLRDVGCVRLFPCPGPDVGMNETKAFGWISRTAPYSVSLQAAAWKPSCLLSFLRPQWLPWDVETRGSQAVYTMPWSWVSCSRGYEALWYYNVMHRGVRDEGEWQKTQEMLAR